MSNVKIIIDDEDVKRRVYKVVDSSLLTSFIGGVSLGLFPFFSFKDYTAASVLAMCFSCFVFFLSRYNGLGFLFLPGGNENEL